MIELNCESFIKFFEFIKIPDNIIKACRCGSTTHKTIRFRDCILNPKNLRNEHVRIDYKLIYYYPY
jgi:hypothetical protein